MLEEEKDYLMLEKDDKEHSSESDGPYCDVQTRNLVLQRMSDKPFDLERRVENERMMGFVRFLSEEEVEERHIAEEEADRIVEEVKTKLKESGDGFTYTLEFFQAIHDEDLRMWAYNAISVSSAVLEGKDAEIEKNPFKYLNLPDNATLGQVRAAYFRLANVWHPDRVDERNPEKLKWFFGDYPTFLSKEDTLDSWVKRMGSLLRPEVLQAAELSKLSTGEQTEYYKNHKAYEIVDSERKKVKKEMIARAHEKMTIINKAYRAALTFFSESERKTSAGFGWIEFEKENVPSRKYGGYAFASALASRFPALEGILTEDHDEYTITEKYDLLQLEGDGELHKNIRYDDSEVLLDTEPRLNFDYGERYILEDGYNQSIELRPFFAWMELRQKKELSPLLLTDIVKECKLNESQAEQLRLMLMNRETIDFMLDTLKIPKDDEWLFRYPAYRILNGPTFTHQTGVRDWVDYALGVELTPKGGMILSYMKQSTPIFGGSLPATAHFTPTDMKTMQAIAYGPLLQELDQI